LFSVFIWLNPDFLENEIQKKRQEGKTKKQKKEKIESKLGGGRAFF
jgi:hypothetical protein